MVNKELLSQDDPLLYGEAARVIITRLFKPSNTHFIPVATLSEILGLHRDVVRDSDAVGRPVHRLRRPRRADRC